MRTYSCAHGGFFPVWLEGQQVPALTTLDVAAIWPVAGSIELSAGGHNLLDPHHPEFGGTPGLVGMRPSAFVKVTWRH